jgi:hypothetical protein
MTTSRDDDLDRLRARQAEIGECLALVQMHGGGETRELEEELAAIEQELKKHGTKKSA